MNTHARRMSQGGQAGRLANLLAQDAVVQTPDESAIRGALDHLLSDRGVNVLAIAGGDGTVHHVINALLKRTEELRSVSHREVPLPRVLVLNGGTLNIVGRSLSIHGRPYRTLARFLRYFDGAPLSRVPSVRLPLLSVGWAGGPRRYGFVFGSEVLYHAIDLYMNFGAGYGGLGRFLFEFGRGVTVGSELWRRERWKLGPFEHRLEIDGRPFDRYCGVMASTVDLALALRAVRAVRRAPLEPGFAVKLILEEDPWRLLTMVPRLMTDRRGAAVRDYPNAQQMRLIGPYTLDGECFDEPAVTAERLALTVEDSDWRLQAVPGRLGANRW